MLEQQVSSTSGASVHRAERSPVSEPRLALADLAAASRLSGIDVLAWRDLEDEEAGGSEIHVHEILRRWAGAGLSVRLRTSAARGHGPSTVRGGYSVDRRSGRYGLFARAGLEVLARRSPPGRGLVEIWNGMPFFTPLLTTSPHLVFLHHVHAEMWDLVLPRPLGTWGRVFESHVAPLAYHHSAVVTLSESSRDEIVETLHIPRSNITVIPPGVDDRFQQGGKRTPHPSLVAVGRLVPVKRLDTLIEAVVRLRSDHPDLELVIVGEGYGRAALEAEIAKARAERFITLAGRVEDDALVELYRRSWVLVAPSQREGWGMTITEAAACGTPAIASDIAGHRDAVVDGVTGLLARSTDELCTYLDRLLTDPSRRGELGRAAAARARALSWDQAALAAFSVLDAESRLERGRSRSGPRPVLGQVRLGG